MVPRPVTDLLVGPLTGQGNLPDDRDGSRNPTGGLGRVGAPTQMSATGRGTLGEDRDGSGDTPEGLRRVWGPSRRSGTDWDSPGYPGWFEGPFQRSRMVCGTLGEVQNKSGDNWVGPGLVWETLPEVSDGSGDPRGCPGLI